jgi:hypothetical protein
LVWRLEPAIRAARIDLAFDHALIVADCCYAETQSVAPLEALKGCPANSGSSPTDASRPKRVPIPTK